MKNFLSNLWFVYKYDFTPKHLKAWFKEQGEEIYYHIRELGWMIVGCFIELINVFLVLLGVVLLPVKPIILCVWRLKEVEKFKNSINNQKDNE